MPLYVQKLKKTIREKSCEIWKARIQLLTLKCQDLEWLWAFSYGHVVSHLLYLASSSDSKKCPFLPENLALKYIDYLSIDRWMDKDVAHIYNAILLSHKKKWNWVICSEVDGPRDCHTEWSKSEREKQISYINSCMWNLEKWYRWTGLQGRNWDTDVENKRMDTKGGKTRGRGVWRWWCDELGDCDWHVYTDMYKSDD